MAEMVEFKIDGKTITAERGASLLDVARANGFDIPSLCHHEAVSPYGACRLCLVEVKQGKRTKLTTSCNYPVLPGIEVTTSNERILKHRRMVIELLLPRAPKAPKLLEIARELGVEKSRFPDQPDSGDCILCGLCERVCREVVGRDALGFSGRGADKQVGPPFGEMTERCIACGACVFVCPTGCIELIQSVEKRRLQRWDRDMEMARCKKCGALFAPKEQLEIFKKLADLPDDFYDNCPGCRPIPTG